MVLHLITGTFYCTLIAHCFDTLCYIFLTWSMLETPWKKKNEYVSYHDNIKLNSFYHLRPPTPVSSVPSLTDTSRAPTKASRTTSWEREFSLSYFPLFQYRGCTAECDDKQKWKLHIFVCHVVSLLSFRTMGALNSKTWWDRNFRIATIDSVLNVADSTCIQPQFSPWKHI